MLILFKFLKGKSCWNSSVPLPPLTSVQPYPGPCSQGPLGSLPTRPLTRTSALPALPTPSTTLPLPHHAVCVQHHRLTAAPRQEPTAF